MMMPVVDGLTVCRRLRASECRTPILMLTARHEVSDRVSGLDAGADDYLREAVLARRAARPAAGAAAPHQRLRQRRAAPGRRPRPRPAAPHGRRAVAGALDLTKTEFDLLELLMLNAGIVLARDTIYDRIWGFDFETGSRSLDVYIGYLRRKTEAEGEPRLAPHRARRRLRRARAVTSAATADEPAVAHRARARAHRRARVRGRRDRRVPRPTSNQLEHSIDESLLGRAAAVEAGSDSGPRRRWIPTDPTASATGGCPPAGTVQPARRGAARRGGRRPSSCASPARRDLPVDARPTARWHATADVRACAP